MNEKTIKDTLQYWLENSMGARHEFTITFDVNFVAGNLIDGSFSVNAVPDAMDQVAFASTHAETLEALRVEIQKNVHIFTAKITGPRQITCKGTPHGGPVVVTGPTVTGGLVQPVATVVTVTAPVKVTVIDAEHNSQESDADPERTNPRPAYPYATLRLDSLVNFGTDGIVKTDGQGITEMGGQRRITVEVNYYGKNPMDQIAEAIKALNLETMHDVFRAAKLAVWVKNSGQNLTGVLETKNEPRGYFDFYLGFAENYEDDTGLIEKVEDLAGQVDSENVGPINVDTDP